MRRTPNTLRGIPIPAGSRRDILETILKGAQSGRHFSLIMSLNPEILVTAERNPLFKKVVRTSRYRIVDGMGVVLAAWIMGIRGTQRYAGVDLMADVIRQAAPRRLSIMLIGGGGNLAKRLADCYSAQYPKLEIAGIKGIGDISHPAAEEEKKLFSIVADRKPHIVFLAFGSPWQELWAYNNRARLGNVMCIGVGGAFDFLSGEVPRAPKIIRNLGFEWLFRLILQPWRWKRQKRLLTFLGLVIRERFGF